MKLIGTNFLTFLQVNLPCNYERIEARRKAWEGGKWVRDTAVVYAQKKQQQAAAKVA